MNAGAKAMKKILSLDSAHVSEIGHTCARVVDSLSRQLSRLETKPVTFADLLLGRVKSDLDIAGAEALLVRVDAALQPGDALFRMEAATHSLRAWRDQLAVIIEHAKTYQAAGVK